VTDGVRAARSISERCNAQQREQRQIDPKEPLEDPMQPVVPPDGENRRKQRQHDGYGQAIDAPQCVTAVRHEYRGYDAVSHEAHDHDDQGHHDTAIAELCA